MVQPHGMVQREKAVNLPYGMQRRLEIARAVVRRPKLILLDEPAAGMNEIGVRRAAREHPQDQGRRSDAPSSSSTTTFGSS